MRCNSFPLNLFVSTNTLPSAPPYVQELQTVQATDASGTYPSCYKPSLAETGNLLNVTGLITAAGQGFASNLAWMTTPLTSREKPSPWSVRHFLKRNHICTPASRSAVVLYSHMCGVV